MSAASFLVGGDADCRWGVPIARVETVVEEAAGQGAVELAAVAEPSAGPARVIRVTGGAHRGHLAVRGRLVVVTVRATQIHPLPALLAAAGSRLAFDAVAIGDDGDPFLIVDVDRVLGGRA